MHVSEDILSQMPEEQVKNTGNIEQKKTKARKTKKLQKELEI